MNTEVKFEASMLLCIKGYKGKSKKGFTILGKLDNPYFGDHFTNGNDNGDLIYEAPLISEVVMWLEEKHGIWIIPSYECKSETFFKKEWFWIALRDGEEIAYQYKDFKSPTEAYLSAINHVLNNLI